MRPPAWTLLVWLATRAAGHDDVTDTTHTTDTTDTATDTVSPSSPPPDELRTTSAGGDTTSLLADQDGGFRRADDSDLGHDTTPPPGDTPGPDDDTGPAEGGTTADDGVQGGAPAGDRGETRSRLRDLFDRFKSVVGSGAANASAANDTGPPGLGELLGQGAGEAVLRAHGARTRHVPSAVELDMAPARGGAVHTLRTKNRLCHRHVMIPEGPKYDSRGKLYLGEFERVKGRAYPHTAEPSLLLPKCCNCCRKSVLGCE